MNATSTDTTKYRIHMEWEDDLHDTIDLEGTIEEIQKQAAEIVERRKPDNYWSEEL